jgi:large subunit ribosomal protein L10
MEEFSKLPTKDELIAKLMGTMKAPVQHVVYVLNAVPTKLVRTLQAVADAKK